MSTDITQKYKITNDTIKPARFNSRGLDIRSNTERVGHAVHFELGKDEYFTLYAGKSTIVDRVTSSILTLHKKKLVSIEVINLVDELKKFTEKPVEAPVADSATLVPPSDIPPSMFGEKKDMPSDIRARAYPMGETREDRLVNPDGEPNFIAKANKDAARKKGSKTILEEEAIN